MLASVLLTALAAASAALAQSTKTSSGSPTSTSSSAMPTKTVWIQVANNQTASNGTAVFTPRQVVANVGDTVMFNFTTPSHTATQSTFVAPCQRAFDSTVGSSAPINGFDSGWRNDSTPSILSVPITRDLQNVTLWFFDTATCGIGGVGGINVNDSSGETLAGFTRNAIRLNGTGSTTTSRSASHSATATGPGASASGGSGSGSSSGAERSAVLGALAAAPLVLAALAL